MNLKNFSSIGCVILAAGTGTRLKLNVPKPLAPLLGKTLLDFALTEIKNYSENFAQKSLITVVVGHKKELLIKHLEVYYPKVTHVTQVEQKGTADALRAYFDGQPEAKNMEWTLVSVADMPLLSMDNFVTLANKVQDNPNCVGGAATFRPSNPTGYGRISRGTPGFHIVEEKECSLEEKKIQEVNSGLYLLKTSYVLEHLYQISNSNKTNELYLTDLFQDRHQVVPVLFESSEFFKGINNLGQLAECRQLLRERKNRELEQTGVILLDASTTYIDWDVKVGAGTTLYPQIVIEGKSSIGENCTVESGVIIKDSVIGTECKLLAYSYLEQSSVGHKVAIGPFARLRPETKLEDEVKIGNFVETKNAHFSKGSKASHLSYIGDAEIGTNSNLGCGFITCNYDGAKKHLTKIGDNVFIGSDCQAIAPIEIASNSFVAAGSTITESIPEGAFAVARSRQVTKEGMATKFLKSKK